MGLSGHFVFQHTARKKNTIHASLRHTAGKDTSVRACKNFYGSKTLHGSKYRLWDGSGTGTTGTGKKRADLVPADSSFSSSCLSVLIEV